MFDTHIHTAPAPLLVCTESAEGNHTRAKILPDPSLLDKRAGPV